MMKTWVFKRSIWSLLTLVMLWGLMPLTAFAAEEPAGKEGTHGHEYEAEVIAPTCTEQGYTLYTCDCGDRYTGDYVEAVGFHTFSQWQTTREASYDADGEESRDCIKCSHVEFRSVKLEVITSGNFGAGTTPSDQVIYTLYSDGTMVVEGEGATFYCNWDASKQPFIDYRDMVKHLIIQEGITVINRGAFAYLSNLETVEFPDMITELSGNSFMGSFVKEVSQITIPASVGTIGVTAFGYSSGSTFFTDIVIENPEIAFPPESNPYYHAVFNHGRNSAKVTLYSYGKDNNVSAYAQAVGSNYIDLHDYAHGETGGIAYSYHDGTLVLEALDDDAAIPTAHQPWAQYRENVETLVLKAGITAIPAGAFRDYTALRTVELPFSLKSIGDGAFAVTEQRGAVLSTTLPRRLEHLGENVFAGRSQVNVTAYFGSIAEDMQEDHVQLTLKRQFKLLMIGNSFTNDAANCSQGMKDSQLFNILQELLGEDAEITLGVITSGGKTMAWHATQAEQGGRKYSFNVVTSQNGLWRSMGSASSEEALSWTDWDAVSVQPYQVNTTTGKEIVPYPEETDAKFYLLEDASAYMLDHAAKYAPHAEVYCYMHWATGSTVALNAEVGRYRQLAAFYPTVLNYAGTESGKRFADLVPVGLSVQNARTTYLALLNYNTDADTLNLQTDIQRGLLRDSVHVSFNIGRYIAGLTFAETLIPEEWRVDGYGLPDIRVTESVGKLPEEYSEIARKAVRAAVESWREGSLAVTEIDGYPEDPAAAAENALESMTLDLPCGNEETVNAQIRAAVLSALPADFAIDAVSVEAEKEIAAVTIRFGYTAVPVEIPCRIAPHDYVNGICADCGERQAGVSIISGRVIGSDAAVSIGGMEMTTVEDGSFAITAPEGVFDVVVQKGGCLTYTVKNVTAEEGDVVLPEIELVVGDVNGDEMINARDIGVFRRDFGKVVENCANPYTDINGDGNVNARDINVLRKNFGKSAAKDCTVEFMA